MRSLLFYIASSLVILFLTACEGGRRDYSRWANISPEGWIYADTVLLLPADTSLHDNDSLVNAALKVALRHSNAYLYSNIWLELTYHTDNHRLVRDTLNIRLADVYGRWLGSGFGASYQREVTVSPAAVIDITRPVALRHIMRVDTLQGIEQVGIEVVR